MCVCDLFHKYQAGSDVPRPKGWRPWHPWCVLWRRPLMPSQLPSRDTSQRGSMGASWETDLESLNLGKTGMWAHKLNKKNLKNTSNLSCLTALLSLLHLITDTISANKTVCVVKEHIWLFKMTLIMFKTRRRRRRRNSVFRQLCFYLFLLTVCSEKCMFSQILEELFKPCS